MQSHTEKQRITIACVEDNPGWIRLIRAGLRPALEKHYPGYCFDIVTLENHALLNEVLKGEPVKPKTMYGRGSGRTVTPDLIITDNMAKDVQGHEKPAGMAWLASRDSKASHIPCIMFTDGEMEPLALMLRDQSVGLVPKRERHNPKYRPFDDLAKQVGRFLELSTEKAADMAGHVESQKSGGTKGR